MCVLAASLPVGFGERIILLTMIRVYNRGSKMLEAQQMKAALEEEGKVICLLRFLCLALYTFGIS